MKKPPDPHHRHRFSAELISHAVWLYHVFSLIDLGPLVRTKHGKLYANQNHPDEATEDVKAMHANEHDEG